MEAKMAEENTKQGAKIGRIQEFATLIQVLSVLIAAVLSIWSFNDTRKKEAEARIDEANRYQQQRADELYRRRIEAAKPFLELRQQKYLEAIKVAGVLVNPQAHTKQEIKDAEKRFGELYWAELSLVEAREVEASMVNLATSLGKFSDVTPQQQASLDLAHTLRDSLVKSWGVDEQYVGRVGK
jgi:hypothetical protein